MAARRSTETHDRRHMRCMGGGGSMTSDRESASAIRPKKRRSRLGPCRTPARRAGARSPPARALATRASAAGRPSGTSAGLDGVLDGVARLCRAPAACAACGCAPPRATSPPGRATRRLVPSFPYAQAPRVPRRISAPPRQLRRHPAAHEHRVDHARRTPPPTRSAARRQAVLSQIWPASRRARLSPPRRLRGAERRPRREPRVQVQVARRGEAERRIAVITTPSRAARAPRVRAQRGVANTPGARRGPRA